MTVNTNIHSGIHKCALSHVLTRDEDEEEEPITVAAYRGEIGRELSDIPFSHGKIGKGRRYVVNGGEGFDVSFDLSYVDLKNPDHYPYVLRTKDEGLIKGDFLSVHAKSIPSQFEVFLHQRVAYKKHVKHSMKSFQLTIKMTHPQTKRQLLHTVTLHPASKHYESRLIKKMNSSYSGMKSTHLSLMSNGFHVVNGDIEYNENLTLDGLSSSQQDENFSLAFESVKYGSSYKIPKKLNLCDDGGNVVLPSMTKLGKRHSSVFQTSPMLSASFSTKETNNTSDINNGGCVDAKKRKTMINFSEFIHRVKKNESIQINKEQYIKLPPLTMINNKNLTPVIDTCN